ncbi:unnamed protein product, partial [Phaeothamnion confervicola]
MEAARIRPNAVTFGAAINGLAGAGDVVGMLAMLERMEEMEIRPTVVVFNACINCCSEGAGRVDGIVDTTLALLKRMRAAGCKPNAISYTAAIKTCAAVADGAQAVKLLEAMRADAFVGGVTESAFLTAMAALSKAGDASGALRLLQEMREAGVSGGNVKACNFALAACAQAGDSAGALLGLLDMRRCGIAPNDISFLTAMTACVKRADVARARKVLAAAEAAAAAVAALSGADVVEATKEREGGCAILSTRLFNVFLNVVADAGGVEEAGAVLSRMRRDGGLITPDAYSFSACLKACLASGDTERSAVQALDFLWQMAADGISPEAGEGLCHRLAMRACGAAGDAAAVLRLLDEFLVLRLGMDAERRAFQVAATACSRAAGSGAGVAVLQRMRQAGHKPSADLYNAVLTALTRGHD